VGTQFIDRGKRKEIFTLRTNNNSKGLRGKERGGHPGNKKPVRTGKKGPAYQINRDIKRPKNNQGADPRVKGGKRNKVSIKQTEKTPGLGHNNNMFILKKNRGKPGSLIHVNNSPKNTPLGEGGDRTK
jgi:hypothetical protein